MPKYSKKIDKRQIDSLCQKLSCHIVDILDYFGVEYYSKDNYLHGPCPVHGGDNPTAFTVYVDGDDMQGNWYCWTHQCQQTYQPTMLGLIRGLLETRQNQKVSFVDAVKFSKKFIKHTDDNFDETSLEKTRFVKSVHSLAKKKTCKTFNVGRKEIRSRLSIPADYYLSRGYRKETLDRFDVGLCVDKTKAMKGRIVVPVYDDDYKSMVGCVGRVAEDNYHGSKWINSKGFNTGHYLYNYWFAQEHIKNTGAVVLVEGQGDVWRLYEAGIKNCVGLFGCKITDAQLIKLESSGAMDLVVLMDNDEAGEKAKQQIKNRCERLFNIHFVNVEDKYKDVGDMSAADISKNIKPLIEYFNNE